MSDKVVCSVNVKFVEHDNGVVCDVVYAGEWSGKRYQILSRHLQRAYRKYQANARLAKKENDVECQQNKHGEKLLETNKEPSNSQQVEQTEQKAPEQKVQKTPLAQQLQYKKK